MARSELCRLHIAFASLSSHPAHLMPLTRLMVAHGNSTLADVKAIL